MTWLRKSLCAAAVASFAAITATGCERNDGILFVRGALAIDTTDCIAAPEDGATLLAGGTLDRSLRAGSYRAALLLGNQLTPRASREQLRVETNLVVVRGAEVTLESITGERLDLSPNPNPYSTLATGEVPPSEGTEPGLGVTFADIVPAGIALSGTVISRVRVFGETLGGTEVESNEYIFPIEICNGCLVNYSASSFDDTNGPSARYLCARSSTDDSGTPACVLGQDRIVDCTLCSAANDVCRDPCRNCEQFDPETCDPASVAPSGCP